jgi:hypothetical protein
VTDRRIFAGASLRDANVPQFDVPLFRNPDGLDAADTMADYYIAADWMD